MFYRDHENPISFTGTDVTPLLQALEDTYQNLPTPLHKELQQVLREWFESANSSSSYPSTRVLHETYGRRMVDFLSRLPSNSPFRRP